MRSTHRICSALAITVILATLAVQASADRVFHDSFSDGNVKDGMPANWGGPVFAQAGDLVLTAKGLPFSRVENLDIQEVSVRTVFELVDGVTIGIGARRSRGPGGDFGYLRFDSVDGSLDAGITTSDPVCCTDLVDSVEVPFDPRQEAVAMQLDMFSENIRLWVWPADGTMPVEPLLEAIASRVGSGTVQLFVGGEDRRQPNPQDFGTGRFRYVHVANSHIPEPTTLLLAVLGMIGPCCFGRRR